MKGDPVPNIQQSEICKFFEGSNILVTGASGFVGILLIEKLLRSCPKVDKIYMLMRSKKGKTCEQRLKEHFQNSVYNRLRQEQPDFMSHIELIEGDTSLSDLGLSIENKKTIIKNVNIVFHGAATVRFDEALKHAVKINVLGTGLILELAKDIKNLKVFVHLSTAFSHCTGKYVGEIFHDSPMQPDEIFSLLNVLDDDLIQYLTPKILEKYPNTYAFTKALGEEIVRQKSVGIPTCIVRPSIMIATNKEPIPGWINNFYGPTGVMVGAGAGILHTLHCTPDNVAEVIPADYVINNIIAAAWGVAVKDEFKQNNGVNENKKDPLIFNSVTSSQNPITWKNFLDYHKDAADPWLCQIGAHYIVMNKYLWIHKLYAFFLHTIPAAIIDLVAVLAGQKPMLSKTYQKINKFCEVIVYFSTQEWEFNNDNTLALWNKMKPVDQKLFYFNVKSLDWLEYARVSTRAIRVYIANEPPSNLEKAKAKARWINIAHYTYVTIIFLFFGWLLFNFIRFVFYFSSYFN